MATENIEFGKLILPPIIGIKHRAGIAFLKISALSKVCLTGMESTPKPPESIRKT